jgi:hypothetical protein
VLPCALRSGAWNLIERPWRLIERPWLIHRRTTNGDTPDVQPRETHPALVRVFAKGAPDQVAPLLAVTGAAVVDAFGPEEGNVVVLFEAAPRGPDVLGLTVPSADQLAAKSIPSNDQSGRRAMGDRSPERFVQVGVGSAHPRPGPHVHPVEGRRIEVDTPDHVAVDGIEHRVREPDTVTESCACCSRSDRFFAPRPPTVASRLRSFDGRQSATGRAVRPSRLPERPGDCAHVGTLTRRAHNAT